VTGSRSASSRRGCPSDDIRRERHDSRDPHGVMGSITTGTSVLRGELIEVQDAALILLASGDGEGGRLRLVPYSVVRSSQFEQLAGRYSIRNGNPPAGEVRERLRLVSRFPHGMSAQVLAELLKTTGQTQLDGIVP
jgi:hypothetical protein